MENSLRLNSAILDAVVNDHSITSNSERASVLRRKNHKSKEIDQICHVRKPLMESTSTLGPQVLILRPNVHVFRLHLKIGSTAIHIVHG